jgi:hypothetical protein
MIPAEGKTADRFSFGFLDAPRPEKPPGPR